MTESRGIRVRRGSRQEWAAQNEGRYFCQCGCGEPIPLKPEHFPHAPRFLHGHNAKASPPRWKPKPPATPCACGCDQLATPGRRYVSGHNARGKHHSAATRRKLAEGKRGKRNPMYGKRAHNSKPPPPQTSCECGCGELATPGRRYISGHNIRGKRLATFKGRRVVNGYVLLSVPSHPFANCEGYVFEHRLVAERSLRTDLDSPHLVTVEDDLYLSPAFVIHHVDGDPANNELGNLQVMTPSEHSRLHHAQGDTRPSGR